MQLRGKFLVFICFCFVNLARGQLISFSVKNESLEKVFLLIEQQSEYNFIYTAEQVSKATPVTLSVKNESIVKVLNKCFSTQPLHYSIDKNHILIKDKPAVYRSLSGKVVDEQGEGVPGVTVAVRSAAHQTATNHNGEFSLASVPVNAVLLISGAEIEPVEINAGSLSFILITVRAKVGVLDETYVIAYGKSTRRRATGTVTSIKREEVLKQPASNPLAILAGRISGLQISPVSGSTGAQWNIRLRGQNSIANGNEPLIMVDGVPYPYSSINTFTGGGVSSSPLAMLNPSDIESIEVLKDADATAIYGSRGANGVILINTRKAQPGRTTLQVRSYTGIGKLTRFLDMLQTPQYLDMRREAFRNDGVTPTSASAPDLFLWDTTRYVNWQKNLLGHTMNLYDAKLDLSGGNALTQFLFTAGYHDESTLLPFNEFGEQKFSTGINVHHRSVDNRLQLNFSSAYARNTIRLPQLDLASLILLPPNAPDLYTPLGNLNWENSTWVNPHSYLRKTFRSESENLLTNMAASFRIGNGLEAKTTLGYTMLRVRDRTQTPKNSFDPAFSATSSAGFGNNASHTIVVEPQLAYTRSLGKLLLQGLAGSTIQSTRQQGLSQLGTGYASDDLLGSLSSASAISIFSETDIRYRYLGFFGRASFNWDQKYMLNVNVRRDGSSRYGPANRFSNFGSVGAAWIFSKEPWLAACRWLSFGKLKGSAGWTGNDQIGDYNYLDLYATLPYSYQSTVPFQPQQLFNPLYRWEKVKKFEAGVDLGFVGDRILLMINYYFNSTANQLVQYGLPPSTGFNSILKNLPARIDNRGWEIEWSSVNIQSRHWKWASSFNLTVPRNRLIRFDNLAQSTYANSYVVGEPLFIAKRYHFTGVDTATGLYTFQDVDHDGKITSPNDLQSIVFTGQQYFGGFHNTITWKKLTLSFLLQFVRQKNATTYLSIFGRPGIASNQPAQVLDHWQKSGDQVSIQRFSNSSGAVNTAYTTYRSSDAAYSDASFIRLRNMYLSYDIGRITGKQSAAAASHVFVQAQNVFTITSYESLDPETKSLMPPVSVFTVGIHLNF